MPEPFAISEQEKAFLLAVRRLHIEYGRIPCIIYIKYFKMERVEFEKAVESVKLTK
jgi:hypothetical protein